MSTYRDRLLKLRWDIFNLELDMGTEIPIGNSLSRAVREIHECLKILNMTEGVPPLTDIEELSFDSVRDYLLKLANPAEVDANDDLILELVGRLKS